MVDRSSGDCGGSNGKGMASLFSSLSWVDRRGRRSTVIGDVWEI